MRKLIAIDDERVVLQAVGEMIRRMDADCDLVATAENGAEGLALIRKLKPDIVITDIRMPGLDGLGMIEQVARELPLCAFIIISGYREFEYAQKAISLNVADFIEKPIDAGALRRAIDRAGSRQDMLLLAHRARDEERAWQDTRRDAQHEAIRRVLDYIHAHYRQNLGLDELADLVGLTPAYLSGLFKESTGVSYIKYLTGVRIDNAKRMLAAGEKAVVVAEMTGYSEYNYFCRVFKKHTGVTPSEYKNSAGES